MSELRAFLPEDCEQHRHLMNHAFGGGRVPEPRTEPYTADDAKHHWGIFDGTRLQASLTICPFDVHWRGTTTASLPMGGIAGVATYAHERGQGHVDRLLRQSLIAMREAGQVISSLYPFAWAFYRKFGWDWVGEEYAVRLPLPLLPRHHGGTEPVQGTLEEKKTLLATRYDNHACNYRGAFTSGSHKWGSTLNPRDNKETFVYGCKDGYLTWRYGKHGDVGEFIATTPEAYTALFGVLRNLGVQREFAHVRLPANTPLWLFLIHDDLKIKVAPVLMGRVVDVEAALHQLTTDTPDGAVVLQVSDPHAEWNTGTWRVTAEGGQVTATRTDAAPEVVCDIQAFSQAYWGQPDLVHLRRAGRVTVQSEAGYAQLCRLLPPHPVFLWDDF
jgi:predicted acetyltransferase